jgi:phosphate transport system protein
MSISVRRRFDYLLSSVRDDVLQMGDMVERALRHAVHTVHTPNAATARWVMDHDQVIDEARYNLENEVIKLFATQQPIMAYDLRFLSTVSAIATELERIGDYANCIAKRVYRNPDCPVQVDLSPDINSMMDITLQMVHTSLEAFLHQDAELARSLGDTDNQVDELEDRLNADIIQMIHENPQVAEAAVSLRDIVHALERAADRATNIGERVIYFVTSDTEELNP